MVPGDIYGPNVGLRASVIGGGELFAETIGGAERHRRCATPDDEQHHIIDGLYPKSAAF